MIYGTDAHFYYSANVPGFTDTEIGSLLAFVNSKSLTIKLSNIEKNGSFRCSVQTIVISFNINIIDLNITIRSLSFFFIISDHILKHSI